MTLPVLLALMASLAAGGARADSEPAAARAWNARCGHDGRPTIAATTATKKSYRDTAHENIALDSTYGEEITVFCANAANLTILNHKKQQLPAEEHNSTTIQVSLQKLDVGDHTYYCTDSHTHCNVSLTVTVHPAVAVMASNVHHTLDRYGRSVYFVPLGENYDVFCSADEAEGLTLDFLNYSNYLQTEGLNATTVFATVTNDIEGRDYVCQKEEIYTFFKVIVDYNPEARDLSCILLLNRKLECSWSSSSKRNTFALSVLKSNRIIAICFEMSGALNAGCARAWNDDLDLLYVYDYDEKLSFQLEACNEVLCQNQTFQIKPKSISKVDPVYNLELLNTSSRSAEIAWRHSNYLCYRSCDYKVKYRLGTQWRQADVSTTECYDLSRDVFCKLQIALPCPNSHYEVRVFVKPLSSIEDRCWSEPASMSFFNTPGRFEVIGPQCGVFRKPEPTPSNAVLHEVRELISDLKLNINQKMAEIEALMDMQA